MNSFKEKVKSVLYFPVDVVYMVWLTLRYVIYVIYVWCRCKITGTKHSEGGHKFGKGYPNGYYKIICGMRYYESGEIAVEEQYIDRCKRLISPKELKELIDRTTKE